MPTVGRRAFLKTLSLVASPLGVTRVSSVCWAGAAPLGLQVTAPSPVWQESALSDLNEWITPTERFFVRHHLDVPKLSTRTWKLVIDGLVERRVEMSYLELLSRARTEQVITLECAGNLPGAGMVGNARWTGVSLASLLKECGVRPGATEVILDGADFGLDEGEYVPTSYSRSIPLEKALAPETLLAFEMNGKTLEVEHGYPLRAVVPEWYAMASVKWLRRIEVTDRPFAGFYMSKRYFTAKRDAVTGEFVVSPVTKMGIKSQITRPANGETLNSEPCKIQGMAWTGHGKVERVEVSLDGGSTWQEARLDKQQAPHAWVFWQYLWQSPPVGKHIILARAFDNQGRTQPVVEDPERVNRYGNNWIHRVKITIVPPGDPTSAIKKQ